MEKMAAYMLLLHACLLGNVLTVCSSFSAGPIQPLTGRSNFALHAESFPSDPFQAVDVPQDGEELNRWLVQKGFNFDSYIRRFDFGGTWVRDSTQSVGVLDYLQAHGLTQDEARTQSERPYTQRFEREKVTADGIVFRVSIDDGRRNTTYELGEWVETVPENFNSAIFVDGSQLKRRTYWNGAQHMTETTTIDGSTDTTSRYLKDANLLVERTYQSLDGESLTCTELFVPAYTTGDSVESLSSSVKRVPGCIANVDVRTTLIPSGNENDYQVSLDGEADALVSRGILALLSQVLDKMTAEEVLSLDPSKVADHLGLRQTLSTGRNDGLASMTKTVQSQIKSLLSGGEVETLVPADAAEGSAFPGTKLSVAVLLSGGVDSSVALNLLKRQGYDITAFYLKIWLEDELAHLGQCPWEDDYRMCEEICDQAGVPLEAISLQKQYKDRVISYTVHEAERGRTPNPDIMCNSRVKFGCFYDAIEGREFDYIASGHYAQLVQDDKTGLKKLLRAPDPVKDQSYFLCGLTQEQLQKVIFPIGHLQKAAVRELAEEFDLPNKNRPDSQGLCFLGKVKFDEFLGAYLGERPGKILDAATNEQIGEHKGVWFHTVGQRKGIGKVLDPKATSRGPWYIVSKDPSRNIVYASNEYDEEVFAAARTKVFIEDIHWINGAPPTELVDGDDGLSFQPGRFQMKIRHGPKIVEGSLVLESSDAGSVTLDNKDGGLAPGQFVVLYTEDECLGAGVMSERHWARFLSDRNEANATANL